jgi:hypothetical protein
VQDLTTLFLSSPQRERERERERVYKQNNGENKPNPYSEQKEYNISGQRR